RSLRKQNEIANWFYIPTWRKSSPLAPEPALPLSEAGVYLVVEDAEQDFSLAKALGHVDHDVPVVLVTKADTFQHLSHNHFKLSPHLREHWDLLLNTLTARGQWPERILHTLNLHD